MKQAERASAAPQVAAASTVGGTVAVDTGTGHLHLLKANSSSKATFISILICRGLQGTQNVSKIQDLGFGVPD